MIGMMGNPGTPAAGLRSAGGAPARVSERDGEAVGRPERPAGLRGRGEADREGCRKSE